MYTFFRARKDYLEKSLLRSFLDDLLRHVWWYFFVLRQLHGARGTALAHTANVVGVAEHVG